MCKCAFYALGHINSYLPAMFKSGQPGWFIYNRLLWTAPLGDFGWNDSSTGYWEALPVNIEKHRFTYVQGGKPLFRARYNKGVCNVDGQ